MKTPLALMALAVGLALPASADAQLFRKPGTPPAPPSGGPASRGFPRNAPASRPAAPATASAAPKDANVLPANSVIPEPANATELPSAKVPLPLEPIEPYLLTKDNGPFMVMAYTFRGPDSEKYAQALAMELRGRHSLPAYVLRLKDFPGKSNIRGVPPTAPGNVRRGELNPPEKFRTEDEATVLVGDEKTQDDQEKLLHRVKKIRPVCLDGLPNIWLQRRGKGLQYAMSTTNPYVPAERLFVQKPDVIVAQMNQAGDHNIHTCPGKYSLQIAEFKGRTEIIGKSGTPGIFNLKRSALATAADDAERLATALSRDKEVSQTGARPYVFHSRYSSRVLMGSFNDPNDPNAARLRDRLLKLATDLNNRNVTDVMIVPATVLTDIKELGKAGGDPTVVTTSQSR